MYFKVLCQMKKQLHQATKWFDAAEAYAQSKPFDANVFLSCRLAPDQLPFTTQVQIASDTAKLMASRLSGKEAPKHADDEKTLADLRTRITDVIAYLEGFTAQDFEGAGTKVISQPRWQGKVMSGEAYFLEHATPNFFFHISHIYAILRHNGVPLGKKDYLGPLSLQEP